MKAKNSGLLCVTPPIRGCQRGFNELKEFFIECKAAVDNRYTCSFMDKCRFTDVLAGKVPVWLVVLKITINPEALRFLHIIK